MFLLCKVVGKENFLSTTALVLIVLRGRNFNKQQRAFLRNNYQMKFSNYALMNYLITLSLMADARNLCPIYCFVHLSLGLTKCISAKLLKHICYHESKKIRKCMAKISVQCYNLLRRLDNLWDVVSPRKVVPVTYKC